MSTKSGQLQVRANARSPENAQEVLALRRQIEDLQAKLDQVANYGPGGTELLAQGADKFSISFSFERQQSKVGKSNRPYWVKVGEETEEIAATWDEIFASIAPTFIEPVNSYTFVNKLNALIEARGRVVVGEKYPGERFANFRIYAEPYETIKVQLRALGLIATTGEKDSWALTEYGDAYMNKLLAVHRKKNGNAAGSTKRSRKSAAK